MKNGVLIAALGWGGLLALSYYLGRQTGPEEPEISASREVESRQLDPVRMLPDRSRDVTALRSEFEALLPERDNIFAHDQLWLRAGEWAAQDPEAAVAWLSELEFPDVRNPYLFSALSQWASDDPAAARLWLEQNIPADEDSALYLRAALIRGMARSDPSGALSELLAQPISLGRSTIDFLLGEQAREGSEALFSFLNLVPSDAGDLRLVALKKAAGQLSREMIPAGLEFSEGLADVEERVAFQEALADRWALMEPQEALAWAAELQQPRVLAVVAKQWARQQPLEASEWLEGQRGALGYDLSARSVAWSVVGLDPDLAFSQVAQMQSEGLRRETSEQLGRFWISDQPQVAKAFLSADQSLPADIRKSLLSHFK
ncbi:hypothetical protein N9891_00440 [bacterium]|nr:hypothetical protein [bacterium]